MVKFYVRDYNYSAFYLHSQVHMRIHSGDKPYSCDICHKTFSLTSSLSKHKRFHQGATNVYTCPVCFEVLLAKEDLNVHLEVVHGAASSSNSSSSRNCTKSKGEEEYVITVEGSDATAAASGDIHQDPLGEEKHTIAFVSEEDGQVGRAAFKL